MISIIVPVYNTECYLNECVDSILKQTYSDFELLLIDDGSVDGSADICDHYLRSDDRVRVLHKTNGGSASARSKGIEMANGNYIFCVDSDDWIDIDLLFSWNKILLREKPDIIISSYVRYEDENSIKKCKDGFRNGVYEKETIKSEIIPYMFCRNKDYSGGIAPFFGNKLIRSDLLKKAIEKIDNTISFGDDLVCTFPSITRSNKIVIDNNICGYYYRYNSNSITQSGDTGYLRKLRGLVETLERCFDDKYMEILSDQILQYEIYMMLKIGKINALRFSKSKAGKLYSLYSYYKFLAESKPFHDILSKAQDNCDLFMKEQYKVICRLLNHSIMTGTIMSII